MSDSEFMLRPMGPEDRNYVLSSWIEDFRRSRWARAVGGAYYSGHTKIVGRLLDNASTMLCVWKDTPDYILGWACTGPGARVHYAYVRADWRRKGIAHILLAPFLGRPCLVTHAINDKRLPDQWALSPYALLDW